ncbi:MAG TPA: tRNA pseudouridine(38-40) synthase TruA [Flavitalea sp.]|nr:tRNA pseudouridine(38-40) synthase TruA [Flavitalea sp.]
MNRYFLEISYKGTNYAGFQIQQNAVTVQEEVEKALAVLFRQKITLTGSSRTDTGVHALQNYFHFDIDQKISEGVIYNLNALLPPDIAANSLRAVDSQAHCRFDAVSRKYRYRIYNRKNPFLQGLAYYYPYTLDILLMEEAARMIMRYADFTAFAKRNSQVKTHNCIILESRWVQEKEYLSYEVKANRFLRGMVRGLTGTMLQVGRGKLSIREFISIIEERDASKTDFSVPAHGLCLEEVLFG